MNGDMAKLDAAMDALIEHFDTVQIFVTRHESGEKGGTVNALLGKGNWYARYGQVRHWLIKEDALTKETEKHGPE